MNTQPLNHKASAQQIKPITFCDKSYNFRITLSPTTFQYNIKIMHKLNNIQLAYIGLEPKSSPINNYSQPLELVLFHIITLCIKCLKGSYYPHLLNNYLINYLNFSGLTKSKRGCTIARKRERKKRELVVREGRKRTKGETSD